MSKELEELKDQRRKAYYEVARLRDCYIRETHNPHFEGLINTRIAPLYNMWQEAGAKFEELEDKVRNFKIKP